MLEVDRVAKSYGSAGGLLTVLDDVSFTLCRGDRLVVMGPSGSGKSTLLSILGVLDDPTSGRVRLDGVDPHALGADARATFRGHHVGFVFQEHHLLDGCSAIDNVLLPALARGRVGDEMLARGRMLLERVGLADRSGHVPAALSGGERQRVAVARALLNSPRLILADEPTGQLDATTAAGVADLLGELTAETDAMLIVVTHSAAIAERIAAGTPGAIRRLVNGRLLP